MQNVFLDYAARGRNAWWRYVLGVILGVMIAMIAGIAVFTPLQFSGLIGDLGGSLLDPAQPVPFFLANGAIFGLLIVGFALAARWLHGKRFGDLLGRWSWRDYGLGVAIWAGVVVVLTLVDFAVAPGGFRFTASLLPAAVLAALAGLALQTFAEEFVFRGYLTQGLLLGLRGAVPAAVASGLLFGALHIPNGVPHAVSAAAFGVTMALITIRTGGIAFTSGMHLINNFYAATLVVSQNDAFKGTPALFTQDTPHLMWFDTALGVVAMVAVTLFVYRRTRLSATAEG